MMNSLKRNVMIAAGLVLIIISQAGCSDQPVVVNNYYITESGGSVQSPAPEQFVSSAASESKQPVSSAETKVTDAAPLTDSNLVVGINYTVTGTKDYLALRNAPAYDGSNEVAKMKNGDELIVQSQNIYGDKGEYCYITAVSGSAKGQSGYVNKNYITPSKIESSVSSKTSSSKAPASKPTESPKAVESKPESKFEPSNVDLLESSVVSEQESSVSEDESNIFDEIPSEFYFSSGAGGWQTVINISGDGSFVGNYIDYDLGNTGSDYPKGSAAICDFAGKFDSVVKIDEHTYSMKVVSLEQEGTQGDVYVEDGTKYTVSSPYGFDNVDEFMLYMPGKPISELPKEFLSWVRIGNRGETVIPDGVYGLYNVNGLQGFRGEK